AKALLRRRSRQPVRPGAAAGPTAAPSSTGVPASAGTTAASTATAWSTTAAASTVVAPAAWSTAPSLAGGCGASGKGSGTTGASAGAGALGACGKAAASSSALKRLPDGVAGALSGFFRRKKLTISQGYRRIAHMLALHPVTAFDTGRRRPRP